MSINRLYFCAKIYGIKHFKYTQTRNYIYSKNASMRYLSCLLRN